MSPDEGADTQDVVVEAVHASLECAGHHVIVGHFAGSPLAGAEAFLDQRLGGRLSARHLLGLYPERIGESDVFDARDPLAGRRGGYPPGAIVVGLDVAGELTREALTGTVSTGLLRHAFRVLEQEDPGQPFGLPQLVEVSAVPLGTSGVGAMSIDGGVAALVDAVASANEQLHRHVDPVSGARTWDRVRIARLEIVEVLGDRAELVAHALLRVEDLMLVDPGSHTRLVVSDRLRTGDGRLPAMPGPEPHAGNWQRVIIRNLAREQPGDGAEGPGTTVLEFTAIGRRARADRMQVPVDTRAVGGLVDAAVRDARPGSQVGATLYELLLPNELKGDLARSENLQLIVDENTADLPWEALTAKLGGSQPRQMALRGGVLRQFRETEAKRPETRPPVGDAALVIANPPLGPALSLPGASREGLEVAKALGWTPDGSGAGAQFDVSALVWGEDQHEGDDRANLIDSFAALHGTPGRRVLEALLSRDWRILHVAAHGRFDAADSSRSGVVVDHVTTLSPNVFRQLPAVPSLVFLNCCHLGRTAAAAELGPVPNRLAASVARELMRCGVQAVVAAGWAVDDSGAVLFARTFYEALLGGALFGDAVLQSRRAVHSRFPESSTWAAFQCYGDPGFRLRAARAPEPGRTTLVSSGELVRRLRTVSVLAAKIGLPNFDDIARHERDLSDELDGLLAGLEEKRWDDPVVFYEFGRAYAELGNYERAVACYRRAWDHRDANRAPMRLLEQLGNLEIRLARSRQRLAGDDRGGEAVTSMVEAAHGHLELALQLGRTPERLALMGSFHKKAATLNGEATGDHLRLAWRHYEEAHRRRIDADGEPRLYYTLNWLQLAHLAGTPVDAPTARALLERFEKVPGPESRDEDFWTRVATADLALTRWLLGWGGTPGAIEAEYRFAFGTRSSRRDRDSVLDHLGVLAALRPGSALTDLADRLRPR